MFEQECISRKLTVLAIGFGGFLGLLVPLKAQNSDNNQLGEQFQKWGQETMIQIDQDFYTQNKPYLYVDSIELKDGKFQKSGAAFMWACGVQLSNLAEAAKADPVTYADRLKAYAKAINVYWQKNDPLGGYDVLPCPKPLDRYYDDNAWVVLALIKTYEVLQDKNYLYKAQATMKFVLSGEDKKLGGGIYWRESPARDAKNTCSTAPALVAALQLYQVTGDQVYLETGERLYQWMRDHLQDKDGLYWDNIKLDGGIDKNKFSYNSALMIRADCLLYEITKEQKYLDEAKRVGQESINKWINPNGSANDGGRFAHLLLGAFLALDKVDNEAKWLDTADRMVVFVHNNLRDSNGRYPGSWTSILEKSQDKFELLDEASVAHAFWEMANAHLNKKK